MAPEQIIQLLKNKYKTDKIKFIGGGSDSWAFILDNVYIIRFLKNKNDIYNKEKQTCDFLSKYISIEIPHIEIVKTDGYIFSKHKMIKGRTWSYHRFILNIRKQKKLADSLGKFISELHSVPCGEIKKNISEIQTFPYIDFNHVVPYIQPYLTKHQLFLLEKKYNSIINKTPKETDIVLCHLGIKGANSVVDKTGALCGIFDFGNCGLYERWRDLAVVYSFGNRKLYKMVAQAYSKYTGIKINHKRISDLAFIEWLWAKRWYSGKTFKPWTNRHRLAKVLSKTFAYFYGFQFYLYRKLLYYIMYYRAKNKQ